MTRPFVPEDLYRIRQVTDVEVHPDGRRVAYVVSWSDEATDANRSEVWLAPDGGPAGHRPLTRAQVATSPRFSPDGASLAYLAGPVRQPLQLQVLSLDGGEPLTLGPFDDGCDSPVWLPDSSGLLVVAPRRPPEQRGRSAAQLAERPRARRITSTRYRFNGRGWIHDRVRQLFHVPLEGGEPTALTEGAADVGQPAVSPDGRLAVFVSARQDDQEFFGGSDLWVVDVPPAHDAESTSIRPTSGDSTSIRPTSGDSTSIRRLTDGQGTWQFARFLADGAQLLAVGQVSRGDAGLALPWLVPLEGGAPRRLGDGETAVHAAAGSQPALALLDDAVLLPGIHRGRVRVDRYPLPGAQDGPPARPTVTTVADEPPVIGPFALSPDGRRLHYAGTSPTRPAELFVLPLGRADDGAHGEGAGEADAGTGARPRRPTRLTGLNDTLVAEVDFVDYEEVEVLAADGYPVHGVVVRPPPTAGAAPSAGPEAGRRPGLVYVHGGPLAQYGLGFFDEFQAAAATGHVLVAGNPRGSEGYGQAHARAITGGGLGGRDWDDVQALADHLSGLAEVDPVRIGIGGGSYGGFMTTWAIGHTDRFAAALSERAVNNWETLESTSDIGAFFTRVYTGATNLSDVAEQRRQSPISYAPRMATPTLILHSEEDWRCPTEQAEQLFVALRQRGVPCELVRFPGENHELTRSGRPSLRVERLRIVHEWWSRWLGSAPFPSP